MKENNSVFRLLAPNLWVVESFMQIQAIPSVLIPPVPTWIEETPVRMTVIELPDKKLFLHSPVPLTPQLKQELKPLGEVAFVVAPSLLHHVNILPYAEVFPKALCLVPQNLKKKRRDLEDFPHLENHRSIGSPYIEQVLLAGHRSEETAFYHPSTRTLIVADLCYNPGMEQGFLGRTFFKIVRAYGKPSLPFYHRLAVKDSKALKKSLQEILAWDFDRIILSHGTIIPSGGKEIFRKIWAWALK